MYVKQIGNVIPVSKSKSDTQFEIPLDYSDLIHMMSGRCALNLLLDDILKTYTPKGKKPRVYFPAYTCETVLAPFLAHGFVIDFYYINANLQPIFDERIRDCDVALITGYYGYNTFEEAKYNNLDITNLNDYLAYAKNKGTTIIFDLTHSIFHQKPLPQIWDYALASYRKWFGIASGGLAFKKSGRFQTETLPYHQGHIGKRNKVLNIAAIIKEIAEAKEASIDICQTKSYQSLPLELKNLRLSELLIKLRSEMEKNFWDAEFQLRDIFASYESDPSSIEIINTFSYVNMINERRRNYQILLERLDSASQVITSKPKWTLVFPDLHPKVCPSHFTLFTDYRQELKEYLEANGVYCKVFWPILKELNEQEKASTRKITDRIISLPIDQECNSKDMEHLAQLLIDFQT